MDPWFPSCLPVFVAKSTSSYLCVLCDLCGKNSLDTQPCIEYNIHLTNSGFLIWKTNQQSKHPSRQRRDSIFCLPSSVSCPTRPSCPACLPSTIVKRALQIALFFCKTNPILIRTKPMQPSLPQRFTKANRPWPLEENKPNQTQFVQSQNDPNPLPRKALWKIFLPLPPRQNKPNQTQFPRPPIPILRPKTSPFSTHSCSSSSNLLRILVHRRCRPADHTLRQ